MRKGFYAFLIFSCGLLWQPCTAPAQNDTTPIPYRTLKEKWMWIHRTIARAITKERPVFFDTSYIKTYKKQLVMTLPISTRWLNFGLHDNLSKQTLRFQPNSQYDLGLSINSRWASFLINTGVRFLNKDEKTMGRTDYKDYQFNFYGKRHTTDLNLQSYKGFYISNSGKLDPAAVSKEQPYLIKRDVRAFVLGVSTMRVFNYKKFSYRNSFAFTEQQLKNAGSFLLGAYYSLLTTTSDSCLIPSLLKPSFDTTAYVKSGIAQSGGANIGYIYTLVIKKKSYITLSLVNGLGFNKVNYARENGVIRSEPYKFSGKLSIRLATGYDNGNIFTGMMGIFDNFNYTPETNVSYDFGYGKLRVFVGYRFNIQKQEHALLKKLKLIEWEAR